MDEINVKDEKFWRQLEVLSLKYISSKIKSAIPQDTELTRKQKDGGFDGSIIIDITEDSTICQKILFESKFRTSIKTLPLTDCSKALIIAFNQAAQTLFLVTNILFSEQSKKEIDVFRKKVNLNVIEVDGKELKKYISINRMELLEQCSEEFLQYIENVSDDNLYIQTEKLEKELKKEANKVSKKNNVSKEVLYQDSIFKKNLKKATYFLKNTGAFILLRGNAGTGKTVFLTKLLDSFQKKGYSTTIFDMQQYQTPQIFFIKILEALWGSDLTQYLLQSVYKGDMQEIKEVIKYNSNGKISEELSDAIMQAICIDSETIKPYKDNYYFLLSKYIFQLLKPYQNNNKIIWTFTNLNKAETEVLDFLYVLLCQIKGTISIIVELRPYFTLETTIPELVNGNYYIKFSSISNNSFTIDVENFKQEDAKKYLGKLLKGMPESQLELIIDKVGTTPLYLNTVAIYLNDQINNMKLPTSAIPNYILNNLIETFDQRENSVIVNSLQYFCKDSQIARCFAITGLLDGILPSSIIENLFDFKECEKLYQKLDSISYYTYKKDAYYVKHNFIYDAMKTNISPRLKYIAAEDIWKCIQIKDIDFQISEEKKFELLYQMQKYKEALEHWNKLVEILYKKHQFYSVIKYGFIAIDCYDDMELNEKNISIRTNIIISILEAYIQIRILNTEKFNELLKEFETICNLNKYYENGEILRARFLFYKWNKLFYNGDIEESYNIIIEAKNIVDTKSIDDKILCANIYWAYALSHKRKTSINQAIQDYKMALEKYPDSSILKIGLNLHEAHTYLRKEPAKTIEICENLLMSINQDTCPYHEVLQIRIDIVMAKFYSKKYREALINCEEVLQISRSINAAYQNGRLLNIYASCLLMQDQDDEAENNFTRAFNEFQESGNTLFGWRALFNMSQLLLKKGKEKKALKNFCKLIDNGIPNLKERIKTLSLENAEMVAFLYTVRILKSYGQYKENEVTKLLHTNEIYRKTEKLDKQSFEKLLNQFSYMHEEYLIILG